MSAKKPTFGTVNYDPSDEPTLQAVRSPSASGRSPSGKVEVAARTHVGLVRESNEDAFALLPDLGLVVVADGMGGHAGGEVASAIVVESITKEIKGIGDYAAAAPALALTAAIRAANDAVREECNRRPQLRGMGSTVVSAIVLDQVAHIAHAGDSRAYQIRKGQIKQITRDHSLIGDYLAENPGAHEDDIDSAYKHLVTRAVGASPTLDVDVNEVSCEPGDVLLFCSDGLSNMVPDSKLASIVNGAKDSLEGLELAVLRLVEAGIQGGGQDNITISLVRFVNP